jgi:hypothetical protein
MSKPSDYGIEMDDPLLAEALTDLIEKGLVVDSGMRRPGRDGKPAIVWVAVPTREQRSKCHE